MNSTCDKPDETAFNNIHPKSKLFYANLLKLIVFKQTRIGPVPLPGGDTSLPFASDNAEESILKLGVYLHMAVGQGNCYSTGLFGPLPALDSEFHCLLYAFLALDPEQKDPRMEGRSYLVACYLYHSSLEPYIMEERKLLEQLLVDFFNSRPRVEEITRDAKKLKKELKRCVLQ